MPPPARNQKGASLVQGDDFNNFEITDSIQEHTESLGKQDARISVIEERFRTPQAFATFLQNCLSDSRAMEALFAKTFCDMLDSNEKVRETFARKMSENDKRDVRKAFKCLAGGVSAIIWLVVGSIITILAERFLGK